MVVNVAPEASQQANEELNFQSKMERVNKELRELTDKETSNDKVENIDKYLNSAFMDELLKNENEETFNTLKKTVNSLMNNPETARAGWEWLTRLDKFLGDIDNQGRMKNDYVEFMEKIKVPSKLNTMKSWEIRRLNLFLWAHEDEALDAYKEMKEIKWSEDRYKMGSEDKRFFNDVWTTLENNYSGNEKFLKNDYEQINNLRKNPSVSGLISVVKNPEDLFISSDKVEIEEKPNAITTERAKEIVIKENNKRINNNEKVVGTIDIDIDGQFTMDDDNKLKYNWEDFTSDVMMKNFWDSIKVVAWEKWSFVNDVERDNTVNKCKDSIFQKLRSKLEDSLKDNGEEQIPENGKEAWGEWTMTNDDFDAMQASLKDSMFIEKDTEGKVSYNLEKTKAYLDSIKDTEWNQLKSKYSTPEWRAWISAVQILLNEEEWDKIKVDWRFWSETRNRIKDYQNEYNKNVPDWWVKLNPDWLPWKNTMKALLGEDPEAEVFRTESSEGKGQGNKSFEGKKQENKSPKLRENASDTERLEYTISKLWLKSTNVSYDNISLPLNAWIYTRDGHDGYYYVNRGYIVYAPKLTSSDKFYTQKLNINTYTETWKEDWNYSYPLVTREWRNYLSEILKENEISKGAEIKFENDKYKFTSPGWERKMNADFFVNWFIFGKPNHIEKDLKTLQYVGEKAKKYKDKIGSFEVREKDNGDYDIWLKLKLGENTYARSYLNCSDELGYHLNKSQLYKMCKLMTDIRNILKK